MEKLFTDIELSVKLKKLSVFISSSLHHCLSIGSMQILYSVETFVYCKICAVDVHTE